MEMPWRCLNLEHFAVGIENEESESDVIRAQSRAVFERLSRLTRLEDLSIGFDDIGRYDPSVQGRDLRLESGLGQLESLESLEYMSFDYTV